MNYLTDATNTVSYTVPKGSCILSWQSQDRHICGYQEESCSSDSECNDYNYGNKACYGRTLQTYGCRSYGMPIQSKDTLDSPDEQKSSQNTFGKKCEMISAETVQCCGDTDCGSKFFCDSATFTCKPQVSCSQDVDCGVSVQCDYTTKKLLTPKCTLGSCTREEKAVDCCNDKNCPTGYYCTAERKCDKKTVVKTECPFDCCVGEDKYFDRVCPGEKPYCNQGVCQTTPPPLLKCSDCYAYAFSYLTGLLQLNKLGIDYIDEKQCKPALLQGNTLCMRQLIELALVPIVLIFAFLFGMEILERFKELRGNKNKTKRMLVSLILSVLLAYLVFVSFILGIVIFVLFILYKMSLGGIRAYSGTRRSFPIP